MLPFLGGYIHTKKSKDIAAFLLEIFLIKESNNLIGWKNFDMQLNK